MQSPDVLDGYEDEVAIRAYLETYWTWFMTDFEKRCHILGVRRAKALLGRSSDLSRRVQAEWEGADEEVRSALDSGVPEFERRTRDRVLGAFRDGILVINRCPECRRVVRTPLTRQCLWCGHDWHR